MGRTFSFYQGSIVVVCLLDCDDFIVVFDERMPNFPRAIDGKRRLLQIYSAKICCAHCAFSHNTVSIINDECTCHSRLLFKGPLWCTE